MHSRKPIRIQTNSTPDTTINDLQEKIRPSTNTINQTKEKWNFIVYIAGNNNLSKFTQRNIKQMVSIGSNERINILVQLDQWGKRDVTRYFIKKNHPLLMEKLENTIENTSGTPESLFNCFKWATLNFPATRNALILWNHGAGILDPHIYGRLLLNNRDELYVFNPETCLLELDRNALIKKLITNDKGIAFNDTFETYLSNDELKETLEKISRELLGGKKIDIVGMDACHMAMVEVGTQIKNNVDYMIGSQEVEPGNGWNYRYILAPLEKKQLSPAELAAQIVKGYKQEYTHITNDYTQSAIDLNKIDLLEKNISAISSRLVGLLSVPIIKNIVTTLKKIRTSSSYTTCFYNYNYIDLCHFYKSLLKNIDQLNTCQQAAEHLPILKENLLAGMGLIKQITIANAAGPALPGAHGLSIYFPTRKIHSSYLKTVFARKTTWLDFVYEYLKKMGRVLDNQVFYNEYDESDTPLPIHAINEEVARIITEGLINEKRPQTRTETIFTFFG
jgi:hypothetical protein